MLARAPSGAFRHSAPSEDRLVRFQTHACSRSRRPLRADPVVVYDLTPVREPEVGTRPDPTLPPLGRLQQDDPRRDRLMTLASLG